MPILGCNTNNDHDPKNTLIKTGDVISTQNSWLEKEEVDDDIENANTSKANLPRLETTTSNVLSRIASRVTTRSLADPGPPPDGGLKAWTQCAMAFLVVFNTWGYVNSFGTFQTYYSSILDETPSTISWIGSIQVWILFFLGAFSGRALDAGLFVPVFIAGSVIQVIGIFTTSLATKYWHLVLTQGICTGIGGGVMFCPAMALLSTYFLTHRGLAVALATTGNSAGGALYPLMVQQLLPQIGFGVRYDIHTPLQYETNIRLVDHASTRFHQPSLSSHRLRIHASSTPSPKNRPSDRLVRIQGMGLHALRHRHVFRSRDTIFHELLRKMHLLHLLHQREQESPLTASSRSLPTAAKQWASRILTPSSC